MARLPAGVTRRKDGLLQKQFMVEGVPKRQTIYGRTVKELQEKETLKRKELAEGLYSPNKKITLNQLFSDWVKEKEHTIKESSLMIYQKSYKIYLAPTFGRCKVKDIERRQITTFMQDVQAKHSASTANRCKSLLFTLLKYAVINEIVPRNVAEYIPAFRVNKKKARETIHRELTEQELTAFFQYCKKSMYLPVFKFMLYTGVRAGECLALQWRDVTRDVIHIQRTITKDKSARAVMGSSTKTRAGKRDIPINQQIREIINAQRTLYLATHSQANMTDLVFPAENGSMALPSSLNVTIEKTLKRMRAKGIEIDHFSSHAFRDTFASRAYRAGMPGNVLKEIMGHESYAMTMDIYSHISIDDKILAMEQLKENTI